MKNSGESEGKVKKVDKREIVSEIQRLKAERNAVIIAHNYQIPDVQDIADFVGDSLQLSREAAKLDYDVIVFVGGYPYNPNGSEEHRIAQEAVAEGKLVTGICNGVITLAKAGVLEGKRVTALTYHPASKLENEGAILTDTDVERDGLVITGNGPDASSKFAAAIAAALEKQGD